MPRFFLAFTMYGGSGTEPFCSTSPMQGAGSQNRTVQYAPLHLSRTSIRASGAARRSRSPSCSLPPARSIASHGVCASAASSEPGQGLSSPPGCAMPSSSTSTRPPVCLRACRRAGTTRASFTTSTSPSPISSVRSLNRRWVTCPVCRSRASKRDSSLRSAGVAAIRRSGSS